MGEGFEAVRRVVEDWPAMTIDDWHAICAPDIKYENMPWGDVVNIGPDAVYAVLEKALGRVDARCEVRAIVQDGAIVMAERLEYFTAKVEGATSRILPVVGVFELKDGKIAAWRDYFDAAAIQG